jgi:hypothetical protein
MGNFSTARARCKWHQPAGRAAYYSAASTDQIALLTAGSRIAIAMDSISS